MPESEKEIFKTAATPKTKIIFLLATAMFFVTFAVIWPEFTARYGRFYGWFLTLIHNPLYALSGLIIPAAFVAGIVTLLRLVYYMRIHVRIDSQSIQMQPGNRRVLWGEVEHLWYSHRNLRYFGFPLPENRSLRLCMRDTKPLDLPHRFNEMDHLVSLVRKHVDPILLARAINIFHAQENIHRVGKNF